MPAEGFLPGVGINVTDRSGLKIPLILFAGLAVLAGCQAGISKERRAMTDPEATFERVSPDPEGYRGTVVMWGGRILGVRNNEKETVLEILEFPLAGNDRPGAGDAGGRFLIVHRGFLDPAVYGPGREVTVVGKVAGTQSRPIDKRDYTYPVVEDIELKLWGPRNPGPRFHIGIGAVFGR
jgi:outer membrane lipoprotein